MLSTTTSTDSKAQRWFYAFLFIHLTVWTLAPTLVRFNLPMDTIEGAIWGHQLAWGYDKNPFVNAWLTALAIKIGGSHSLAIYFVSQLAVSFCFWSIWQLAKKIVPPLYAVISIMLLEGMQYYNLHAIELNDNTIDLCMWGLTILFFYQALTQKRYRDWLLTGTFAGLAMMTKYYVLVLLLCMLLFMLINKTVRVQFRNLHFYAGVVVFLLIISPHIVWLFSHDFVTVTYALERADTPPTWTAHLTQPLRFAFDQISVALPCLVLILPLCIGRKNATSQKFAIKNFDKEFLLWMGIGPFLITLVMSFLLGLQLHAAWGQPLLSLWGLLLVCLLKPHIDTKRFYFFAAGIYFVMILLAAGYGIALTRAEKPSSANYPGKIIANHITSQWNATYHKPLKFVAGPRWLAGNIAHYSSDHPSVYIDWNKKLSPWIDEEILRQEGAVFVWDPEEDHQISLEEIKSRFEDLTDIQTLHFMWLRNANAKPVELMVAVLAPKKKTLKKSV